MVSAPTEPRSTAAAPRIKPSVPVAIGVMIAYAVIFTHSLVRDRQIVVTQSGFETANFD